MDKLFIAAATIVVFGHYSLKAYDEGRMMWHQPAYAAVQTPMPKRTLKRAPRQPGKTPNVPNGRPMHWKSQVTAYTSEPGQTDSTPCISADNKDICRRHARWKRQSGHGKRFPFRYCASADRDIPMYSILQIGDAGQCVVVDRTNKRTDGTGQVDLYFGKGRHAKRTALQWGRQNQRISIVRWGP